MIDCGAGVPVEESCLVFFRAVGAEWVVRVCIGLNPAIHKVVDSIVVFFILTFDISLGDVWSNVEISKHNLRTSVVFAIHKPHHRVQLVLILALVVLFAIVSIIVTIVKYRQIGACMGA